MTENNRLAAGLAFLIAVAGVSAPALHAAEDPPRPAQAQIVVDPEALPSLLNSASDANARPILLDVRGADAYAGGHVAGAIHLDAAQWKDETFSAGSGLENEAAWVQRIGALGVTGKAPVIVYDDGRMTEAARIWFILQNFGVPRVAVVNGGFRTIEPLAKAGRLTLSTEPVTPAPAESHPTTQPAAVGLADRGRVKESLAAKEVQILDARTEDEFDGSNRGKNLRGGHLPGARNLPHAELLDAKGRLKPPAELAKLFEEAGFQRGRPIIAHCQSGGRSSLAALAAEQAGFGPVMNYYMSFGEWSADETCPVVAGD